MQSITPTNSELWLEAIGKTEQRQSFDSVSAVNYLVLLKDLLIGGPDQNHRASWNQPPHFPPPHPIWENVTNSSYTTGTVNNSYTQLQTMSANVDTLAEPISIASSINPNGAGHQLHNNPSSNLYSVFNLEDDDISDEEIVYDPHSNNRLVSRQSRDNVPSSCVAMSIRRILLRVYCCLAEIHSSWAVEYSKNRKWTNGADEFEHAYVTL